MNTLDKIFAAQYSANAAMPGPFGHRLLTYADYIASGQPLSIIEDYIRDNVFPYYANTHTEASFTGHHTGHLREEARSLIKKCVNATDEDVLIFCGTGSTAAVDKINRLLVQRAKDNNENFIILYGPYEHHSNVLPWRESNFIPIQTGITQDGLVCLEDLERKLKTYQGMGTVIGSFSAASNVTGIISPVDEITHLLHRYGAYAFWDYAAGAPYMKIDMNPGPGLQKDAIFISTHKFIGGPGTPGILVAKRHLFSNAKPLVPSGGTVHFVTRNKQRYFEDIETREEGGTPGIIESVRAGLCFKLKAEVGVELIEQRERVALDYAFAELKEHPNMFILGNTDCKRLAFLSFHIRLGNRFLHHNFVVALLNDLFGIQSRGGCSCAGPYGHELLQLSDEKSDEYMHELATGNVGIKPGWARLSLNYFIPDYEVRYIVRALKWVAEKGFLLLKDYRFDDNNALWTHVSYERPAPQSLYNFSTDFTTAVGAAFADTTRRAAQQAAYFEVADAIAADARRRWVNVSPQSYGHNQVDNPLRWYALAQDVSESMVYGNEAVPA